MSYIKAIIHFGQKVVNRLLGVGQKLYPQQAHPFGKNETTFPHHDPTDRKKAVHTYRHTVRSVLTFLTASLLICCSVYFAEKYFVVSHRYLIGWAMLVILVILGQINYYKQPPGRIFFIMLAGLISARYMVWRTTSTLVYTNVFDLIGTGALYAAEVYSIVIHFLGMFVSVWPLERGKVSPLGDPPLFPTVDVFIPTYSEPPDLVKRTATAATLIEYPKDKLRIHILDDGSTATKRASGDDYGTAWDRYRLIRRIAEDVGVMYIARDENVHAKAGNINFALRKTHGDLILVLDCDHIPTRDILKNTVAYFQKDPNLGFVQSPHFLGNPSIIEKNISSFSNAPRESDMFYNLIHRGLDTWNSSYFCGSAAILRRTALEKIGGLSVNSITEDVETSMKIHAHGYNSVYVRQPMICGLEPETFASFAIQKVRWAQGMAQIFVLNNPLLQKGISLAQRLSYFNACFYWFFSFSRLFFFIAPILFLAFGMRIYHASSFQIISYTLPHVLSVYVLMSFLYGRSRRPFLSEIYETCQMMFLAPALVAVLLRPRSPVFRITPKDDNIGKEALNLKGALPVYFILLINLAAIPLSFHKWFLYPLYRDVILIGSIWCVYNAFIAIMALGAFHERKEARSNYRFRVKEEVTLYFPKQKKTVEADVRDISFGGMNVDLQPLGWLSQVGDSEVASANSSSEPADEDIVVSVLDSAGSRFRLFARLTILKTLKDKKLRCGVRFDMAKNSYADIVRLIYGDSQRWVGILRARNAGKRRDLFMDIYYFLIRGFKGALVCTFYLATLLFAPIRKHMLLPIKTLRMSLGWFREFYAIAQQRLRGCPK